MLCYFKDSKVKGIQKNWGISFMVERVNDEEF
jgi:hypothetical protein